MRHLQLDRYAGHAGGGASGVGDYKAVDRHHLIRACEPGGRPSGHGFHAGMRQATEQQPHRGGHQKRGPACAGTARAGAAGIR